MKTDKATVGKPTCESLGIRSVTVRVYALLLRPNGATIAELRKAADADGRLRSRDAMHVMLRRLDERLAEHGLAIVRLVADRTYRLVPR